MHTIPETNVRSTDRIITLEVMDGQKAKSSTGMTDTRLFNGGQQLRLTMDPNTCLWSFRYSNNGLLPGGLEGQFTGFKAGLKHAENYFSKRNIKISAIKD